MKKFLFPIKKIIGNILLNPIVWIYYMCLAFLIIIGISPFWVLTVVVLFVTLFNYLPYLLIKKQESLYHNSISNFKDDLCHVLVLGGGHNPDPDILYEQQLNNSSLRRVLEGVRITNLNTNSLLIMCGRSLKLGHPSQAEIQAQVALNLGVNPNKIVTIPEPFNTEEEATFYHSMYGFHKTPIFIVTKAIHLKRALFIFKSFGYNLIPAPAYFIYKNFDPSFIWLLMPNFHLILYFREYLKEKVGFIWLKFQIPLGIKTFPSQKLQTSI